MTLSHYLDLFSSKFPGFDRTTAWVSFVTVLGHQATIDIKFHGIMKSNLFTIVVGESGSGKSAILDHAIDSVNATALVGGMTPSGLMKALAKDSNVLSYINDAGSEITKIAKNNAGRDGLIAALCRAWDGKHLIADALQGRDDADVQNDPKLSLLWDANPDAFSNLLQNSELFGGFLYRVVICKNHPIKNWDPFVDAKHSDADFDKLKCKIIKFLGKFFSVSVPRACIEIGRKMMTPYRDQASRHGWMNRVVENSIKMSAIITCFNEFDENVTEAAFNPNVDIDVDVFKKVLYNLLKMTNSTINLISNSSHNETYQRILRTFDKVQENNKCMLNKVLIYSHEKARDFHDIITTLVERGDFVVEEGDRGKILKRIRDVENDDSVLKIVKREMNKKIDVKNVETLAVEAAVDDDNYIEIDDEDAAIDAAIIAEADAAALLMLQKYEDDEDEHLDEDEQYLPPSNGKDED